MDYKTPDTNQPDAPSAMDLYAIPTLVLWLVLMAAGLVPETVYTWLREGGRVTTQSAIINSPLILTFGMSIYLAAFTYRRCAELDLTEKVAQRSALKMGILAVTAFLALPSQGTVVQEYSLFALFLAYRQIGDSYLRNVVFGVGAAKLFCWWYIMTVLLRYYLFNNPYVFVQQLRPAPSEATVEDGTIDPETPDQNKESCQHE